MRQEECLTDKNLTVSILTFGNLLSYVNLRKMFSKNKSKTIATEFEHLSDLFDEMVSCHFNCIRNVN